MYENSYAYIPQWLNVQCIDALPKIKLFVQKKIKELWDVFGVLCALLRCCSPLSWWSHSTWSLISWEPRRTFPKASLNKTSAGLHRHCWKEAGIELGSQHSTVWGKSNTRVKFPWNSENCKHREVCSRSKKKKHKRGKCKKQEMETYVRIILSWFSKKWLQNFHSSGTFLKCLCKAVEKLENEQRA